ncbi:hypothetical protein QJS10_CPB12g01654 [Acorus calamus]|uniref:Uncharacterized protein n=1 Tax=Acorus calamus TaxID=4465 RepID=A0AAV9DPX6_ACOCL|nr:hypothetical protein QJS10_CPB12g01654 [Acorus calamus]
MISHAPSYPYSPTSQRPLRHRIENPLKKRTSHLSFFSKRSSLSGHRRLVLVAGAKKGNSEKKNKADSHVFVPRPDEATGLKQKKVQEDGRELPEFLDPEEEKLFEFLSLQLESDLNVERSKAYVIFFTPRKDRSMVFCNQLIYSVLSTCFWIQHFERSHAPQDQTLLPCVLGRNYWINI